MAKSLAVFVFFAAGILTAYGQKRPTLGDMFLGGAVLQRDTEVVVWGSSTDSRVVVMLEGTPPLHTAVDTSGEWKVTFPPQPAAYNLSLWVRDAIGEDHSVVSFGETILCVGQSNMGMQVGPSERAFDADNASAENAASVHYSGKIFLHSGLGRWKPAKGVSVDSTTWYSVTPDSIATFSAVCWLTGRDLFNHLGGKVPVGLALNADGGHAIESWLGPEELKACGITTPCVATQPSSEIFNTTILPMQPYTFGAMVYDQAEQDIACKPHDRIAAYPCMQAQLIQSYREGFNSSFPFVAVQLPGYTDGVFPMRLAQEKGTAMVTNAAILPTYDLSCAFGKNDGCPHGHVHNVHKQPVGARLALMLRKMKLGENVTAAGPRVVGTRISQEPTSTFTIHMAFDQNYLSLRGTRNCTSCCADDVSDFDFSIDGWTWYNGTAAQVPPMGEQNTVKVSVKMSAAPKFARYTANHVFPQCAVYNQEGLPAYPFQQSGLKESAETAVDLIV